MGRRFLIVNNGMTGQRGHYYETALSVAEAARRSGLHVSLAAHAVCPPDGMPDWIDFHPAFRVDHPGRVVLDQTGPPWVGSLDDLYSLDPRKGRSLRRGPSMDRLSAMCRRLAPGLYHRLRDIRRSWRAWCAPATPAIDLPGEPPRPHLLIQAARRLALDEQRREIRLVRLFHDDLVRFLQATDAGPHDTVYLPTAHGREALAIRHLQHVRGEHTLPRFHLELRFTVSAADRPTGTPLNHEVLPYSWAHRVYFDAVREYPRTQRLALHTDTDELAEEYQALSGLPFSVLPIPFRSELFPPPADRTTLPRRILFLGDCRREKGFHLLPGLVRSLRHDLMETGQISFVIQATTSPCERDGIRHALDELSAYPPSQVRLIGAEGFLEPRAYYQALVDADVVLCPYAVERYRLASSGVFTEAVAAGKPTIVPAGTWLANQQPAGSGATFTDSRSLIEAVRRVCRSYPTYHERAVQASAFWLTRHTPARLVDLLLAGGEARDIDAA